MLPEGKQEKALLIGSTNKARKNENQRYETEG
jgi:hypothetical protein